MVYANAPVELGQVLEVKVDAAGPHGQGVARIEEFVIFVTGARVGQSAKVKITKVARTFAEALRVG
ncbi:MAG: TRAM domain-containing protein [Candidatus Micrarchaeota archaeon]|nr:TRAM domain-containing protein [Candidatus Micrarchaeota archaeon]